MEIVLLNLRSLKHVKCETKMSPDAIKWSIKPKLPQLTTFGTLFMEKNRRVLVSFCIKLPKCVWQKHAQAWDVAMVAKGGRRRLKKCWFWNLVYLKCQKISSPKLKAFLSYLGKCTGGGGGGGGQCVPPPPPGWNRVNQALCTSSDLLFFVISCLRFF